MVVAMKIILPPTHKHLYAHLASLGDSNDINENYDIFILYIHFSLFTKVLGL